MKIYSRRETKDLNKKELADFIVGTKLCTIYFNLIISTSEEELTRKICQEASTQSNGGNGKEMMILTSKPDILLLLVVEQKTSQKREWLSKLLTRKSEKRDRKREKGDRLQTGEETEK